MLHYDAVPPLEQLRDIYTVPVFIFYHFLYILQNTNYRYSTTLFQAEKAKAKINLL